MNNYLLYLNSLYMAFIFCQGIHGQTTVQIPIVKDAVIFSDTTAMGAYKTDGKGNQMAVGRTGPSNGNSLRRILLAATLSDSLPSGAQIISAELHLTLIKAANTPNSTISLHRVLTNWGEGFLPAPESNGNGRAAEKGEVTWVAAFQDSVAWATPGGDFDSIASSSLAVDKVIGTKIWQGLGPDVQDMLDSPSLNFGWTLIGDEAKNSSVRLFSSREDTTGNPFLLVTYEGSSTSIKPKTEPLINIFPNPTHSFLHVSVDLPKGQNWELHIQDITGRTLYTYREALGNRRLNHRISVKPWPSGIYTLQFIQDGHQLYKRVQIH